MIDSKPFIGNRLVPLSVKERLGSNSFRDSRGVRLAPVANHLMFDRRIDSNILVVGKGVCCASHDKGSSTTKTSNQGVRGAVAQPGIADTVGLDLALPKRAIEIDVRKG